MKLTPRFVQALRTLKATGYERVASWVGSVKDTTYVKVWTIGELIRMSKKYSSVRAVPPLPNKGMWRGHMNTRHLTHKDIRASQVVQTAEKLGRLQEINQ